MTGRAEPARWRRRVAFLAASLPVVAVAAWLRFDGALWDDGYLLHPDERFLLMLAADAQLPESLGTYLRAEASPLDPRHLGRDFFVYGTLPLTLLVAVNSVLDVPDWAGLALLGRRMAALADWLTTLGVVLLALLLARREARPPALAVFAGLLYALAVLPIQAAHFFTCDPFMLLFANLSLVVGLLAAERSSPAFAACAGLLLGLAVACKVQGLLVAPLLVAFVALPPRREATGGLQGRRAVACTLVLLGAYVGLRVGDPVFFEDASWLDPRPSQALRADLAELGRLSSPDVFYPPALQWIDRTPALPLLHDLAWFGLGLPHFALALLGLGAALRPPTGARTWAALWVLLVFVGLSMRFVQSLRYTLLLLPVVLALAAFPVASGLRRLRSPPARVLAAATGLALLASWPLAFRAIYQEPHPRVRASQWIRAHVPRGSSIAVEHWDDPLPLRRPGEPERYALRELPVFLPDEPRKWHRMEALLADADLLVLSSRRGHGSIRRLPDRFPHMARFYEDLFAGRTPFEKVAQFTSFPTLFGIRLDDQGAEEAFTVYDHPEVIIFARRDSR